jgi:NCAIR mutase (PurE)-related protein
MNAEQIHKLLEAVSSGKLSIASASRQLCGLACENLGHTRIDHQRPLRNGFPETIYGAGKTPEQIAEIFATMSKSGNVLATRISQQAADAVSQNISDAKYDPLSRTIVLRRKPIDYQGGKVVVVTAGTSDLPVAEEARITAEMFGNHTEIISDVGVAGIQRLFDVLDQIREAAVVIVIAGMEGALASVIGGLVEAPVIAVPSSIGYGAAFSGMAALLGMLTSCASGITVVNIDNGFGAACAATRINRTTKGNSK